LNGKKIGLLRSGTFVDFVASLAENPNAVIAVSLLIARLESPTWRHPLLFHGILRNLFCLHFWTS